ncbi:MAG: hypothetical protein HYY40_00870 [Bacteroidetes bacterium]|nr:hypothetical protein [Bacteroidota bacterium]
MYTTYHLNADNLGEGFLKSVKAMFKSRNISIIIEDEYAETEYLLSSDANRKILLKRIKDVREGKNLVSVNLKDL